MSAVFSGAQELLLTGAPPVTAYPYTVGLWVYPTAVNNATYLIWWAQGSLASASNYAFIGQSPGTDFSFAVDSGPGIVEAQGGTVVINQWYFCLARGISATNRRMAVLMPDGSVLHVQNTTSRTPTPANQTLGNLKRSGLNNFAQARIAEWWMADVDVQADGAQLNESTLRQLAFGGPFSLPHIAKNIAEYRRLRSRIDSRADDAEEHFKRGVREEWTNTTGVTLGPHPPAADGYYGPLPYLAPPVVI